jgi:hypothetical protein
LSFTLLVFGVAIGFNTARAANTAGTLDKTFATSGVAVTTLTNASKTAPSSIDSSFAHSREQARKTTAKTTATGTDGC